MTMTVDQTNGVMTPPAVLLSDKRSQWLEEMKGKSINIIFEDCNMLLIAMNLKDRRLVLDLKHVSLDQQETKVKAKISEYNRYDGIILNVLSGVFSVFGGLIKIEIPMLPGITVGQLLVGSSPLISEYKKHSDEWSTARVTGHDHIYQIQGTVSNDHGQRMRSAEDKVSQIYNNTLQLHNNQQRSFESILSGA
jgi:hypothetical protein